VGDLSRTRSRGTIDSRLDGLRVAILATDGFEQVELTDPREALEDAGAATEVVSPEDAQIKRWNHTEWGQKFAVDQRLSDADSKDYVALSLPGGVMNPDALRRQPAAVAAICHGPWTITESGLASNYRMTSWPSLLRLFASRQQGKRDPRVASRSGADQTPRA
jgi:protease I